MLENKKNENDVQLIPRLSEWRNHDNEGKFEKKLERLAWGIRKNLRIHKHLADKRIHAMKK